MHKKENKYDVVIVGGGITGTSLLYALSNYTDIPRIALIEKYDDFGKVNSHHNTNSQTLHFGDIETNYSLEKASVVKEAADMLVIYLEKYAKEAFVKVSKMVMAVGEEEIAELQKRFEEFKTLFPSLKMINRKELESIEPNVVAGRDDKEKVIALHTKDGFSVNFKKLSQSFVKEALRSNKKIDTFLGSEVKGIERENGFYSIETSDGVLKAESVAVTAGPHSLIFAKDLGYGKNMGLLPVAGSFYCAKNILRGKVYTMQIKKLPFAAVHGDPDVINPHETRFGPTAKVLPMLERYNYKTIGDFFKTSVWNLRGIISLIKIISDPTLFLYVLKNILYDFPIIGKWFFLLDARKIVPSLKYSDLKFGKGIGGVRPQVVNTRSMKLEMGEAEIVGDNILFNITPSPGASVSLKNAEQDALKIVNFFNGKYRFEEKRWCNDFKSTMQQCVE